MIEHELGDADGKADAIFAASIAQSDATTGDEAAAACVAYVELLMQKRHFNKAMQVLVALALEDFSPSSDSVPEYRKLQARKSLADKSKARLDEIREASVELAPDQVFRESPAITYVKAKVYLLVMTRSKSEAIQEIEVALRSVPEATAMHRFVRERLYELYANVLQVIESRGHSANLLLFGVLRRGLAEFPDNLALVRFAVTLEGQVSLLKLKYKNKFAVYKIIVLKFTNR